MNWILEIALVILTASFIVKIVRLALGPSLLDRALVLETMIITAISFGAFSAYMFDDLYVVDYLLVLSIMPFVASVALAKYLGGKNPE